MISVKCPNELTSSSISLSNYTVPRFLAKLFVLLGNSKATDCFDCFETTD